MGSAFDEHQGPQGSQGPRRPDPTDDPDARWAPEGTWSAGDARGGGANSGAEAAHGAGDRINPYLDGNFAPVTTELKVEEILPMEGAIPPGLEGMLVRNGPNPAIVPDPASHHWFSGDGMVHAIEFSRGRATSYQNRWVRTRQLAAETGSRSPRGPIEPINGPANTHVVFHAGRLLALVESGFPHALSSELATLRIEDFDGMLTSPMTAHPHVDPDTGGMAFFGYDVFGPPYLRYHEMDAVGSLVHTTEIDLPRSTMIHDFAVTATRIVFLDLPVVFDFDMAARGVGIPFRWIPGAGARVGVMDRFGRGSDIRWVSIDPCYVFHVMNAYDDGTAVVMDVCKYPRMFDVGEGGFLGSSLATLERWRVDLGSQASSGTGSGNRSGNRSGTGGGTGGRGVSLTPIDDRFVEFPRIDDTVAGRPYRYGYCVEMDRREGEGWRGRSDTFDAILRYDRVRDEVARWDPGEGRSPGEPVFVRAEDGRSDDEGWILTIVFDPARGASDVVILDASSFGSEPEAVIHLPARIPYGFHGSWIPATAFA